MVRNVGAIVYLDDVERIDIKAPGGTDTITVNDLSGTDAHQIGVDLGSPSGDGDGQVDTVLVNGTSGTDAVRITGTPAGAASVSGLPVAVFVISADRGVHVLRVTALGDDDVIAASDLPFDALDLVLDGGVGDDVILGGLGADELFGNAGDDVLVGGPGLTVWTVASATMSVSTARSRSTFPETTRLLP